MSNQWPVNFSGKWVLESNHNFEEFLESINVNILFRKLASSSSTGNDIEQKADSNIFKMLITTLRGTSDQSHPVPCKDFESLNLSGEKIKLTSYWDGDVLETLSHPREESGSDRLVKVRRYLQGDKMIVELTNVTKNVTGKRIFKRA